MSKKTNQAKPARKHNAAFTLVELLTVIAVIGILAAIIIPATSKALDAARKTTASNQLRQLAIAYNAYLAETPNARPIQADNLHAWVCDFAKKTQLNDPALWIIASDSLVDASGLPMPERIYDENGDLDPDFANFPLSFAVVSSLPRSSASTSTPLMWARGLSESSGRWSEEDGVWGSSGGFVAFADGHVEWLESLASSERPIRDRKTHKRTERITDALSPNAKILTYTK